MEGTVREYLLYVPAAYDESEKWPLVVSLHGYNMTKEGYSGFDRLGTVADTAHFLIAYPQGLTVTIPLGTSSGWNVDGARSTTDDFAFLDRLIDHVDEDYPIDQERVQAVGYSLGGIMALASACRLSHRLASVAGIAGYLPDYFIEQGCERTHPVSVLQFHGTNDWYYVPYEGTPGNDVLSHPLMDTISGWAESNQCAQDPVVTEMPDMELSDSTTATRIEYVGCAGGSEVIHYRINGGGHTWPGYLPQGSSAQIGFSNLDIDSAALIGAFIARHAHPNAVNGPRVALDVDMSSALDSQTDRHVGVVGSTPPLDWTRPVRLYEDLGSNVWGRSIRVDAAQPGPVAYRFVHYAPDGTDLQEEAPFGGVRTVTVSGSDVIVPVAFWSDSGDQAPDEPALTSPSPGTTTLSTVRLQWEGGATTGRYDVEVDTSGAFTDPQARREDFRGRLVDVTGLDTAITYHWRVRARNAAGSSAWQGATFFTVGQTVYPAAPGQDAAAVSQNVTFRWRPYPDGTRYYLQYSTDPTFVVRDGASTPDTFHTVTAPLEANRTYYWRVRLQSTPWSPVRSFGTVAVGVETGDGLPTAYRLLESYPNPFNPATTIGYELPEAADVSLTVTDVLGREVRRLVTGSQPPGSHEVVFDAADLPSGIYFYTLTSGDFSDTRKMVLLR